MAYVDPALRPRLDAMPPCLREQVLRADIRLETVYDLMSCLDRVRVQAPTEGQKFFEEI